MPKYKRYSTMKIFAVIGGILVLVESFLSFVGRSFTIFISLGGSIIGPIIGIILGLVVFLACVRPEDPIPFNAVLFLILGILIIIFSSLIGGILVLIAGVLGLVK
ncbi:MAG: hypothetical protein ACTSYC_04675 [Promethearchaeota archaeon]